MCLISSSTAMMRATTASSSRSARIPPKSEPAILALICCGELSGRTSWLDDIYAAMLVLCTGGPPLLATASSSHQNATCVGSCWSNKLGSITPPLYSDVDRSNYSTTTDTLTNNHLADKTALKANN